MKPKKIAQTMPDPDGDFVTYYAMWSEDHDRFMLDIHFTDKMDTAFLQSLILGLIEDCQAIDQDMFKMPDISQIDALH